MYAEISDVLSGHKVESVKGGSSGGSIVLEGGQVLEAAEAVVVATEGSAAARLLGSALDTSPSTSQDPVGTCCLYFR